MLKTSGSTPKSYPWLWIITGLTAAFGVLFHFHYFAEVRIAEANHHHMLSDLLADELKQSSEDLSALVHTYISTRNPAYKAHIEESLDIIDGKKPHSAPPVLWNRRHGDPDSTDESLPYPFILGEASVERLQDAGITPAEVVKLKEAEHAATDLIRLQYRVVAEVPSVSPPCQGSGIKNEELHRNVANYSQMADIVGPLSGFQKLVEKRVQTAVSQAEKECRILRLSMLFIGVLIIFFFVRLIQIMRREKSELLQYRTHLEDLVVERTEALSKSEEQFRFIAENSAEVIWTMELTSQKITYVSPSVFQMRGFSPEEVMAVPASASLTKESWERLLQRLESSTEEWIDGNRFNQAQTIEVEQLHKEGHTVPTELVTVLRPDNEGRPAVVLGMARDITRRAENEAFIRKLAFRDNLTQLANRRLLIDRLDLAVARAAREHSRIALLYIDLDRFKPVNDDLGHEAGDQLLKDVAQRIQGCVRAYDTPARFGGDEFIVLLPDLKQIEESIRTAERILAALNAPFYSETGKRLHISASIGVALYPDHGTCVRDLLRAGDEAMYRAKNEGRNMVQLLDPDQLQCSAKYPNEAGGIALRIPWKDNFSSGIPEIDRELRLLFDEVNDLLSDTNVIHSQPELFLQNFDRFIADVRAHFKHEISRMRDSGYPELEARERENSALLDRADTLARKVKSEEPPVEEIVEFLTVELIADHLFKDDKEILPHP